MSNATAYLVHHIDGKLAGLSPIPSERCIYSLHDGLRKVNENAYEPEIVAIGPYHRGKDKLQPMEDHKLRYLQQLLERRNETSVERYITTMQQLEERARKFYEPVSLDTNEFVEMMLLDSCFIIELFRKYVMKELINAVDPIFQMKYIRYSLRRDLILFENQFPFFVLGKFFDMTKILDSKDNIIEMSFVFLGTIIPGHFLGPPERNLEEYDTKHLLGLLHYCCCFQFHMLASQQDVINNVPMKSATEIKEAGIKFKKFEGWSLFNIRFANGTMELPTLEVEDYTETFLRNVIVYEQYLPDSSQNYFTAYMDLMDCLVNSSKDVQILSRHGIIHNNLGDNEVVSTMLNNLGNNVILSSKCFHKVYNSVNKHCSRRRNKWWAILKRDYFNTPWAHISFVAAVVLLLLTMTQTVFSILAVVLPSSSHNSC